VIICCHEYDESFFKYYNYHSLNERTWLSWHNLLELRVPLNFLKFVLRS
jgi:hypothetical protein